MANSAFPRSLLTRLVERLDRRMGIALLEQRLGSEHLCGDRRLVELERNPHLGEHFIEAFQRKQCLAEHDATFHGGRPSEQPQSADLYCLLELPGGDQRLAAANEVALRHFWV